MPLGLVSEIVDLNANGVALIGVYGGADVFFFQIFILENVAILQQQHCQLHKLPWHK